MEEHGEHRQLVGRAARRLGWAFALFGLAMPAAAAAPCRLALTLAIDVSSSVDAQEYHLQNEGLARALVAPEVVAAFLSAPGQSVALHVFEWSGRTHQTVRVDWTPIGARADLEVVAARLRAQPRSGSGLPTAIGTALAFGAQALAARRDCPAHVIDISGDGVNNAGPTPELARLAPDFDAVTVNGLVIGPTHATLLAYYHRFVIQGPGAFVEVAEDFTDFETAMRRKLVRELSATVVGQRSGP